MLDERFDEQLRVEVESGNGKAINIWKGKEVEEEVLIELNDPNANGELLQEAYNRGQELLSIEIKNDKRATSTGNLFIEFQKKDTNGEVVPSGISTTEASVHVFRMRSGASLICRTSRVLAFARAAYVKKNTRWAGDDYRFHGALVPIHELLFYEEPREHSGSVESAA